MPEVAPDIEQTSISSSGSPKLEVTSPGQLQQLRTSMDDFFAPHITDDLPTEAPPAPPETKPSEPVAPEPKAPKPETTPPPAGEPPATRPPETKPTADLDSEADAELDAYKLPDGVKSDVGEQFKNLRGKAKEHKRLASSLRSELDTARSEIENLKKTPVPDEVQKELAELRSYRLSQDITADPKFQARFDTPLKNCETDICNLILSTAPENEDLKRYVGELQKVGPRNLQRDWWDENVINKLPEGLRKQQLVSKVIQMYDTQEARNKELADLGKDGEGYKKRMQQQEEAYWHQYGLDAANEVKLMKDAGEFGEFATLVEPMDEAKAKDEAERAKVKAHNEARAPYEKKFQDYMILGHDGKARGLARVAGYAVQGHYFKDQLERTQKELGEVKADRDRIKSQLDQIMAKQKIGGRGGTAPSTATAPGKKVGGSVEDAFKQHEHIFLGGGSK